MLEESHSEIKYIAWCPYLLGLVAKKTLNDGTQLFHQPDIYLCLERAVLFLRNMFKLFGHT